MLSSVDINNWIGRHLFDVIPISTAVIDQDFNLVLANKAFEKLFGSWEAKKCYRVYKNRDSMCTFCKGAAAFEDGSPKINDEVGYNKQGKLTRYIKHTIPIKDEDGSIPFLIEMAIDVTETEQLKEEYQLLFEQVPCDILIFDRNYKIVQTNQRAKNRFGPIEGTYCFEILKNRTSRCEDCTAHRTFENGETQTGRSTVVDKEGNKVELLVTTVPFHEEDGKFDFVLEMAVDITRTLELQDELKLANDFMTSMISSSLYGTIAVNELDQITIFNDAAKRIFNVADPQQLSNEDLTEMFPKGFMDTVSVSDGPVYLADTMAKTENGDSFAARITGLNLKSNDRYMGKAFWVRDLRAIKKLESDKLEAERLAAVGQTVAGLAHGIKNVLTGLEGGVYMLNSGLQKGNAERSQKGMEMLNRNTSRVSTFVREFLSFSKGQEIEVSLCDPVEIAKETVDTYAVKAEKLGVELISDLDTQLQPAAMDSEGMLECLSNLVGNAIDACMLSEEPEGSRVTVRVLEENETIIYEVIDNGMGMDYEIKKKVFTTFFTTKGLGGTGLGLLMTKKIIQQHGGKVDFITTPGEGTTFRIVLPRERLPKPAKSVVKTEQPIPQSLS
jgi:PAS domain S-box-containing protein